MEALHFGPPSRRLFGVYHPASRALDRDAGVVLCHPMGQEHVRSHRAYQQIATRLSEAGLHTLRFDFSGSGDSALDFEECGLDAWQEDLALALDELVDGTGVGRLGVVGARLGASLAALASSERDDVDALVLWNPVISGADYVQDVSAQHDEFFVGSFAVPNVPAGRTESLGFEFSPRLVEQLQTLDLLDHARPRVRQVLLLDADLEPQASLEPYAEALRQAGLEVDAMREPSPPIWRRHKDDEFGNVSVPADVLDRLVGWLAENCR